MPGQPSKDPGPKNPWGQAGLALMIPSLLAAGPIAGYLLAMLIRHATGWGFWVTALMVFVGLIAGARETYQVIRRISS